MVGSAPVEVTLPNIALFAVAVAYAISLIKDWRPIRTLRAENRQLRDDLSAAETKISDLEGEVRKLQRATDLTVLQDEHRKIAEVLERVTGRLEGLDHAVKANTAAVELLSKQSLISEAIKESNA